MTLLEALQSTVQYAETNTLEKVLIDLELTAGDTYTAANSGEIEVATAHVLLIAARAPDFKEGSLFIKWTPAALLAEANRLFDKNSVTTDFAGATIKSRKVW